MSWTHRTGTRSRAYRKVSLSLAYAFAFSGVSGAAALAESPWHAPAVEALVAVHGAPAEPSNARVLPAALSDEEDLPGAEAPEADPAPVPAPVKELAPAARRYLRTLPPDDDEDWAGPDPEDEEDPVVAALGAPEETPTAEQEADAAATDSGLLLTPEQRLADVVPEHLKPHFDLLLYVSKAAEGIYAQHMWVYKRAPDGSLSLAHFWPVSTGRERHEGYFTTTPPGLYKLDPHRFKKVHHSSIWGGARMPYTMFLDYGYRTKRSGLAIHGTMRSTHGDLGTRASGGCIRVATANARFLFNLIQGSYRGQVPAFAFDETNGHTDRTGRVETDEEGNTVFVDGLRALLIVDDFGGPSA